MNVLVACEFSGVVRDAFRKRGHNAWSCDLLPTESSPQFHLRAPIQRFVRSMRGGEIDARTRHGAWCNPVTGEDVGTWHDWEWDLMIAHPPCTHLAVSGARWFKDKTKEQVEAIRFVEMLWSANVPRIAIENPVGVLPRLSKLGKATQYIQPWQFGHGETKKTGLWLKNLPPLESTNVVEGREGRVWKMPPGPDRWKERSRTYVGIAEAMAEQWGCLPNAGLEPLARKEP